MRKVGVASVSTNSDSVFERATMLLRHDSMRVITLSLIAPTSSIKMFIAVCYVNV